MKTSTTKLKSGSTVMLRLKDGSYGYGLLLDRPYAAFYNLHTRVPLNDTERIRGSQVLFTVAIDEPSSKRWQVLDVRPLSPEERGPVLQFIQDIGDPMRCTIYSSDGTSWAATPQECLGIEPAAVWEIEHIEERLLDALLGNPNKWVESMKIKLP